VRVVIIAVTTIGIAAVTTVGISIMIK